MKSIDRKLLFHLVDIVWQEAHEDQSVPSTDWSRRMIIKAIERRREEKYTKSKTNIFCKLLHPDESFRPVWNLMSDQEQIMMLTQKEHFLMYKQAMINKYEDATRI